MPTMERSSELTHDRRPEDAVDEVGQPVEHRRINESASLLRRPINTIVRRQSVQVQPIVTQPTGDCSCSPTDSR